ncbi:MAG TPA: YkgJ family cysteine cluster protein [Tepidisphaeraceae bacterium]|nr:YkgJ family cysteine cluster protein [Tepidisphaeraceae bacterium]
MKLTVLSTDPAGSPWYADGLKFTCTQCGNCCTGGPGFVWISETEVARLAEYLKLTPQETLERYCRKVAGRISLKERRTPQGNYDCVFLTEQSTPAENGKPANKKRGCSIYPVRPLQCRTWPFWPEILRSPEAWEFAGRRCHGMSAGDRHFGREKIESIRDAADWPDNPPTSAPDRKAESPQRRRERGESGRR